MVKRFLVFLLTVILVCSASTSFAAGVGTTVKMKVTITATCSDYNHVGKQWKKEFTRNGSSLKHGSTVLFKVGETVNFAAKITEEDKRPDVGTAKKTKKLTANDLSKGFSITLPVNVRENAGRYVGCVAKWIVTYSFKPMK